MKRSLPRALSGITASKAETSSALLSATGSPFVREKKLPAAGGACTSAEDMVWLPSSRNAGECHLRASPDDIRAPRHFYGGSTWIVETSPGRPAILGRPCGSRFRPSEIGERECQDKCDSQLNVCVDKPLLRHSRALVHHKKKSVRTNMRGHSGA